MDGALQPLDNQNIMRTYKLFFFVPALLGGLAPGILSLAGTGTGELALTQTPDTTGIYKDRSDSLDATVFVGRQNGNYLSRGKELRTEVISSAGLKKMPCCDIHDA